METKPWYENRTPSRPCAEGPGCAGDSSQTYLTSNGRRRTEPEPEPEPEPERRSALAPAPGFEGSSALAPGFALESESAPILASGLEPASDSASESVPASGFAPEPARLGGNAAMLVVPQTTYQALAGRLGEATEGLDFFNGSVGVDTPQGHARLTCTLILLRDETTRALLSALPVWWEFHLQQATGEVLADFTWSELDRYLVKP